jgi:hypothetical protein
MPYYGNAKGARDAKQYISKFQEREENAKRGTGYGLADGIRQET